MLNQGMNWGRCTFEMPAGLHERLKQRARGLKGGKEGLLRYVYAGLGLWALQEPDDVLRTLVQAVQELEGLREDEIQGVMKVIADGQPSQSEAVKRYVARGRELYAQVVRERRERESQSRHRKA